MMDKSFLWQGEGLDEREFLLFSMELPAERLKISNINNTINRMCRDDFPINYRQPRGIIFANHSDATYLDATSTIFSKF